MVKIRLEVSNMEKRKAVVKEVNLSKSAVTGTEFLELELQVTIFARVPYNNEHGYQLFSELEESIGEALDMRDLKDLEDKLKGRELQIMVTYRPERWDGYERQLPRVVGFRPKSPRGEVV